MTKGLTIDHETADRITVLCLKDSFDYMQTEIAEIDKRLAELADVPKYQMEDYTYNKRVCEAIRIVAHHFGTSV
jgi:hypothetical protein